MALLAKDVVRHCNLLIFSSPSFSFLGLQKCLNDQTKWHLSYSNLHSGYIYVYILYVLSRSPVRHATFPRKQPI